jgi:hypothetical protein
MLDETWVFPNLYVCDPTEKRKVLRVRLSGHFEANGATYNTTAEQTEVVVALPEGGFAGQTVEVNLH